MGGSFVIARIAHIPVRIHWSISLIFIWLIVIAVSSGLNGTQVLFMTGMVFSVFLIMIIHELGHGLVASFLKVKTEDILISPIGGLARFAYLPKTPWKEILIALGGPVVNLLVAGILFGIAHSMDEQAGFFHPRFWRLEGEPDFLRYLFQINLVILLLNVLPIYPLDGGRVLRALLSIWLSRTVATRIASGLGLVASSLIIARGIIFGDEILIILGVLVFGATMHEIKTARPTE